MPIHQLKQSSIKIHSFPKINLSLYLNTHCTTMHYISDEQPWLAEGMSAAHKDFETGRQGGSV